MENTKNFINIGELREITEAAITKNREASNSKLPEIIEAIKLEAEKGYWEVVMVNKVDEYNAAELRKMGFKVELRVKGTNLQGGYESWAISWKK